MIGILSPSAARPGRRGLLAPALACGLALAALAPAAAAAEVATGPAPVVGAAASSDSQRGPVGTSAANPSATVEQCVSASVQVERSATFSGEMTAMSGTGRMSMRIELQERLPGDALFHTVAAPGLGVWRYASPTVKVYRYIKQVTDLSAPAVYRAAIRFRWLTSKGKLIKALERHTATCVQPLLAPPETSAPAAGV